MKYLAKFIICIFINSTIYSQGEMRPLSALIIKNSDTWNIITKKIKESKNPVKVLPRNLSDAETALYQTQITTKSTMGTIIYETGGILIDNGWIRILGSGSKSLDRTVMSWNLGKSFKEIGEKPLFLLIADDAIGGFYAINGGGLDSIEIGKVFYFAPDNIKWNNMHMSYSDFLNFCFYGNLNEFYRGLRWKTWKRDVANLNGNECFSFFPFLWSKEGQNDINKNSRKEVPIQELWDLYFTKVKTQDYK